MSIEANKAVIRRYWNELWNEKRGEIIAIRRVAVHDDAPRQHIARAGEGLGQARRYHVSQQKGIHIHAGRHGVVHDERHILLMQKQHLGHTTQIHAFHQWITRQLGKNARERL